jgi:hypothetical protein
MLIFGNSVLPTGATRPALAQCSENAENHSRIVCCADPCRPGGRHSQAHAAASGCVGLQADTSLRKAKNVIGIPVPLHRLERWVGSPPFGNCSVVGRWSSVVGWVERSETHQRLGCFEDGFRCALPILQRWKHPDFRKKPPAHREYLRNLWCIGVASWSQSEFGNQQIRQTNTGLVRQLVGVLSDSSAV